MKMPFWPITLPRVLVAIGLAVALAAPAAAQTSYTWNTGSGTWSTTTNWTPTAPTNGPSGSGTTAVFNDTATNRTVSSTAALSLGGLSMTQTTADVLNEVLFGGTTTITNAVTLGASSGTARLSFLGSTSAMTATFTNGITINAGGQLIAGINTASNYRTTAVNGLITISGGLFEMNGLYNGATLTGQNVTNSSGVTMTSGTLRFGAGMGTFTPSGNLSITGGTLINDTTSTSLNLSGATNTIGPALSSGSSYGPLLAARNGDQSITLGANAPSFSQLSLRSNGVKTVTAAANAPALNTLRLEQNAGTQTTLKLGSNLTFTNGTLSMASAGTFGFDIGTYTLTWSSTSAGWTSATNGTNLSTFNLTGNGGSLKARNFTLNTANTAVNVGPGLVLEATGTANSLVNTLSGSGTIDPTSIFRYSGGASAANPATLVSDRAIGDVEVTNGALRITGLTTAQAVRITGGTLDLNNSNYSFTSAVVNGGTIASGTLTSTGLIDARVGSVSANLAGSVGLTKTTSGTVTLAGVNAYSGATTINAGRLGVAAAGGINSSSGVTINGGELNYNSATALSAPITFTAGTLSGTGAIGTAVTVGTSDILSPGNSPGSQAFTSGLTLASGGRYVWEINNWTGAAGTNYDQLVVSGSALNVTATSGSTFTIAVTGLTAGNVAGVVPNFTGSTGTSFTIATSAAGITGFDKGDFTVDATGFTNNNTLPTNAGFWVSQSGNNLVLNYAPSATYVLSAAASTTAIRVGGSSTITATIASSTASLTNPDQFVFAGLAVTSAGGLSATSGTLAPGASMSGSVAFTPASAGAFTFTPSITSGSNMNIGTAANAGSISAATVTVYNPAAANTLSTSVSLGNVHVGGSFNTQSLSIWNTGTAAAAYQEGLAGWVSGTTGGASGSGSFGNLFTGGTSTAITVGLGAASTATGGVKSGTVSLAFTSTGTTSGGATGLSPLMLSSQSVTVTGTAWNYAAANAISGTVNLGTVLKGTSLSQTLSITNTAPSDGFSEKLDAVFGTLSGVTTNSGSVSLLATGGTSTAMTIYLASGSAGSATGSAQVNFSSNGAGTSGLGTTSLESQIVSLTATVLDPAVASFTSGSTATMSLLLDFHSVQQNASVSPLGFDLFNLMQKSGYTADLALLQVLSDTGNSAAITTTLPNQFFNLAAGGSFSYSASFSTATLGSFQNVYTLQFKSANDGSAFAGDATQNLTLTIQGVVVVPEPGAIAVAGIGVACAGWALRRRRRPE